MDASTDAGGPTDAGGAPDAFDSAWGLPACADSPEPPPVLPGEYAVDRFELAAAAGDSELPIAAYVPVGVVGAPVAIVLGGGSIGGQRYDWLGQLLASHGYAAAIVQRPGATARIDWPSSVVTALATGAVADRVDTATVGLIGHSYGGMFSICMLDPAGCPLALEAPDDPLALAGVMTLMSHAQPPDEPQADTPLATGDAVVVMVRGGRDGRVSEEEVHATFDRMAGDGMRVLAVLQGVNHYQPIDCLEPDNDSFSFDNPADVSHAAALVRAGEVAISFMRALAGDATALDGLADREGIDVEASAP